MKRKLAEFRQRVLRHLQRRILSGLLILIPMAATFFVLRILFNFLLIFIRPWSKIRLGEIPPWGVSAIAFLVLIGLIYLLGVVTTRVFGRRLLKYFEGLVLRVPLVKSIYGGAKQILDTFRTTGQRNFKSVVVIEYPQPGSYGLAFVTNEFKAPDGKRMFSVFMPTTPNPTSGFLFLLDETKLRPASISVEEAVKIIISGGVILPSDMTFPGVSGSVPDQPGF
jgi:uncharacterized membrane protein